MAINALINSTPQLAPGRLTENTLNLKVGQQLDVKVIGADIQAAKNAITLSLGDKSISVQSNQPVALNSGQTLKIQVTQVTPGIEFKIIEPLPELNAQTLKLPLTELRLSLNALTRTLAQGKEPMQPTAGNAGQTTAQNNKVVTDKNTDNLPSSSFVPLKQPLDAKIISIIGSKIQLQLVNPSTAKSDNQQPILITVDRSQLGQAPSALKPGQNLTLEMIKTGTTPEFKIIVTASQISEAKVAEFVKQFLPRHEPAPLFLNQLIKELPKLMNNAGVPETLKQLAAKIIQNLPAKEQLITRQGLKQAIVNSGLFFEAKLPPAMAQAQLINQLPQLIENESVPQSLQRIAAEILQNLTQKQPATNNPGVEQRLAQAHPELTAPGINPADDGIDSPTTSKLPMTAPTNTLVVPPDTTGKSALQDAGANDFKANLLKLIHALKQEINPKGEQSNSQTDIDLLKNLQHKTENTVAKVVLDQLMSLPKEDSPKQVWVIDLPFIDRQQAKTVKIEIQQDKHNQQQTDDNNWSVNITVTPPELGTIYCAVSFQNALINTFFKSQNTKTTELIKRHLDYLKNQLEASGLTTGNMAAYDGAEKPLALHAHQLSGKKLFDDNA